VRPQENTCQRQWERAYTFYRLTSTFYRELGLGCGAQRQAEIICPRKCIKKLLTYVFCCIRISLNLKLNIISLEGKIERYLFFTLLRINLNLNLTHIFHEPASPECKDGRATGKAQAVGSETYLTGTSQDPTPEDARKDGHICSPPAADS